MNKKGQALVEFVLVLPVLLLVIICVIDIGNIYTKKIELEKDLELICEYYENREIEKLNTYVTNQNIDFSIANEDDLKILSVKKIFKINAPILSNIIGKNYPIEAKKPILESANE